MKPPRKSQKKFSVEPYHHPWTAGPCTLNGCIRCGKGHGYHHGYCNECWSEYKRWLGEEYREREFDSVYWVIYMRKMGYGWRLLRREG